MPAIPFHEWGLTSKVVPLLCDEKLIAWMRTAVEEWRTEATQRHRSLFVDAGIPCPPFQSAGWAHVLNLRPVLDREVFVKLSRPWPILPAEVALAARDHLCVTPAEFEQAFERFAWCCARIECQPHRRESFIAYTFDRDDFFPGSRDVASQERDDVSPFFGEEYDEEVHTTPSGFRIRVAGLVRATASDTDELAKFDMRLSIDASCSKAAMHTAEQELQPLLRTVFRTLALAGHFDFVDFEDGEEPRSDQTGFDQVRECLDAYFMPASKKDTLAGRRLRNTIRLLMEADAARHPMVSLALSMSALEAMVGSKNSGIGDEIARNTTALLQPDRLKRPAHIASIKRLYDHRSKLLHGEQVEGSETGDTTANVLAHNARCLASRAVKAVLEWRRWKHRLGDETDRSADFLDELRQCDQTGNRMMGVPDYLASHGG